LDSTTGKEILNLFLELNQEGVTLILVTHEQKIAEQAKRIMQMRDGKIISDTINGVVSC
ncbi:MAG TPA: macrolide ABC transporter ATP-binding protein, partial [Nitrospina sp.]|nr:macrolide ABC transporter ATP-binding protein [Nitrospina sp.]